MVAEIRTIIAGLAAAGVITVGVGAQSAQAEGTLDKLIEAGSAKIAIANEPPYSSIDGDGNIGGAAPDVARAVLQELGIKEVEAVVVDYGAMIPGLLANRFDLVAAGLYIKPDRCEAVLFSEPDVCDAEAFAVKAGNPKGLTTYKSLAAAGAKVGVCGGCAEEGYALEAGVSQSDIVVIPDGPSGISMLQNGRIDAVALAGLSITDLVRKANDPEIEIVYPVGDAPQSCAGAAFRPADKDFRDAYDAALAKVKASGNFKEIVDTYGFATQTALTKTRADYCPGN